MPSDALLAQNLVKLRVKDAAGVWHAAGVVKVPRAAGSTDSGFLPVTRTAIMKPPNRAHAEASANEGGSGVRLVRMWVDEAGSLRWAQKLLLEDATDVVVDGVDVVDDAAQLNALMGQAAQSRLARVPAWQVPATAPSAALRGGGERHGHVESVPASRLRHGHGSEGAAPRRSALGYLRPPSPPSIRLEPPSDCSICGPATVDSDGLERDSLDKPTSNRRGLGVSDHMLQIDMSLSSLGGDDTGSDLGAE